MVPGWVHRTAPALETTPSPAIKYGVPKTEAEKPKFLGLTPFSLDSGGVVWLDRKLVEYVRERYICTQ